MARSRPAAVTTMGILNIVFGSLSLLCMVCGGVFMIIFLNERGGGMFGPLGVNPVADMWEFMKRDLPAYPAITVINFIVGFLMGALLLLAGIGLLNMQGWARVVSILYSIVMILMQIGMLIFQLAFVNPAAERWHRDFAARFPGLVIQGDLSGNSVFNAAVAVLSAIVWMIYAIVLLIMMLTPSVSAAFSSGWKAEGYERDRADEGDEYERRRRREWGD